MTKAAYSMIAELNDDELAAALGNMIVAWSFAESLMQTLVRRLLRTEQELATKVFSNAPTFESRTKLIRSLLASAITPALRLKWHGLNLAAIDKEVEKLSALSKTRNGWVHDSWAESVDGSEIVIFDYRKPPNTPGRRRPVKAADVRFHSKTVVARAMTLHGLLQGR